MFLLFSSMEPRFFKQQYVFILCVWSSAEFSISKYYFVCFCHLIEWQANMFFLFVFMSFSRMEPRFIKQQYFLKFDFYHIMKPNFFKKWILFYVLPFSRMAGSSFFVFLAFIRMLVRFSDIKMEPIFLSHNVFLFYVFVI